MSTDATSSSSSHFPPLSPIATVASAGVCTRCVAQLRGSYHVVNEMVTCATCRHAAEAEHSSGGFGRALAYGLGAAIAGAIGYYLFVRVTGMEWGLITALVGIGVGQAVRMGSRSRGGRKFQLLAVVLAYLSMGGAYLPYGAAGFIEGMKNGEHSSTAPAVANEGHAAAATDQLSADSAVATEEEATTPESDAAASQPKQLAAANQKSAKVGGGLLALGVVVILIGGVLALFAMPVIVAFASPLSGLIMCFALFRAWKQNAGAPTELRVAGPFRMGTPPSAV